MASDTAEPRLSDELRAYCPNASCWLRVASSQSLRPARLRTVEPRSRREVPGVAPLSACSRAFSSCRWRSCVRSDAWCSAGQPQGAVAGARLHTRCNIRFGDAINVDRLCPKALLHPAHGTDASHQKRSRGLPALEPVTCRFYHRFYRSQTERLADAALLDGSNYQAIIGESSDSHIAVPHLGTSPPG